MARPHPTRFLFPLCALALGACQKAPAEPEGRPAASVDAAPAVKPLAWDAPGAWTKLPDPKPGPEKASYRIPSVGNDKEEADIHVLFYGTGSKGDPAAIVKEWNQQFDPGAVVKREEIAHASLKIELIDILGTYKIALTPPARGKKQPPVQMVKSNWRLHGAVVRTPDKGNWFFKMVGPDETVQAARSAFRGMIESAR